MCKGIFHGELWGIAMFILSYWYHFQFYFISLMFFSGYYGNATGLTSCIMCPTGFYSNGASASCFSCAAGSIHNATSNRCVTCPSGTYASSTQCMDCPLFYTGSDANCSSMPLNFSLLNSKFQYSQVILRDFSPGYSRWMCYHCTYCLSCTTQFEPLKLSGIRITR